MRKLIVQWVFPSILITVGISLLLASQFIRTPTFASIRPWDIYGSIAICLIVLGCEVALFAHRKFRALLIVDGVIILLFSLTLLRVSTREVAFQRVKEQVIEAPQTDEVWHIGQHFIVGYRNYEEIATLVEAGGVGGLFISQRNVQGKTVNQVKEEIASLQNIQKKHNRPPLFVATDQEGGIVSRLSPPLIYRPSLGSHIYNVVKDKAQEMVHSYAASQAAELRSLGINVNFAPVVDLDYGINDPNDKFSKISDRAIATDAATVTDVAHQYVLTLLDDGIVSTLKHFPGLGNVKGDSHVGEVVLSAEKNVLAAKDWIPFERIANTTNAFVMVGHVRATAIDPDNPASVSRIIIQNTLRDELQVQNIVITDDFSMAPIFNRPGSVGQGAIDTLNAGADLILIAYDTDLYYDTMKTTRAAYQLGKLDKKLLEESSKRLEEVRSSLH